MDLLSGRCVLSYKVIKPLKSYRSNSQDFLEHLKHDLGFSFYTKQCWTQTLNNSQAFGPDLNYAEIDFGSIELVSPSVEQGNF